MKCSHSSMLSLQSSVSVLLRSMKILIIVRPELNMESAELTMRWVVPSVTHVLVSCTFSELCAGHKGSWGKDLKIDIKDNLSDREGRYI